jgi:uncharacterized protein with NRDE domain
MCLVVVAFNVQDNYPLVVAANRDEFHARPTQNAGWWPDQPDIVAGRDLQAGGTWLGLHRAGRFATITNFRDAKTGRGKLRSRGHLVTDFLLTEQSPLDYLQSISPDNYAGFNLLVADRECLAYLSNRGGGVRKLPAGVYGLSNATLDTPWEKVERSKSRLGKILAQGDANDTRLLRLLDDREKGPLSEVRSDRLPFATAHAITAPFIVTPEYGTRCSSIVRADSNGRWQLLERRFDAAGKNTGESQYSFNVGENRQ